jgi:hypothetical protein
MMFYLVVVILGIIGKNFFVKSRFFYVILNYI